jgi:hypothetical protein
VGSSSSVPLAAVGVDAATASAEITAGKVITAALA